MLVYVFVLLLVIVVFSFGCFVPVKRLAGKIVSEMTCNVTWIPSNNVVEDDEGHCCK